MRRALFTLALLALTGMGGLAAPPMDELRLSVARIQAGLENGISLAGLRAARQEIAARSAVTGLKGDQREAVKRLDAALAALAGAWQQLLAPYSCGGEGPRSPEVRRGCAIHLAPYFTAVGVEVPELGPFRQLDWELGPLIGAAQRTAADTLNVLSVRVQ